MPDKKELKREYKENPPAMGVYQIRNLVNEKIFVGSTLNLTGIFNRYKFQLDVGSHQNKSLQTDWTKFGAENFSFEVLEEIFPRETSDHKSDLEVFEDLWLEKLKPFGEQGYNEPKKTRGERLQMIAAKKRNSDDEKLD